MTDQELFDALAIPFSSAEIHWRVGRIVGNQCVPLAYLDARDVQDRLDRVCGPGGWQDEYPRTSNQDIFVCKIGIRLPETGDWVWRADGADPTDIEGPKGMLSGAFKRAAVKFGVGRYLYDLKSGLVDVDGKKISDKALKSLRDLHDQKVEEWGWDVGYRPGAYAFRLLGSAIKEFVIDAASAQDFRNKNAGTIAQLPVRMRQRINETLDNAGAPATEAA